MRSPTAKVLLALAMAASLFLCGCPEQAVQVTSRPPAPQPHPQPPEVVTPASHGELKEFFAARNYDWNTVAEGVPPFLLGALPGDLDRIPRVAEKKRVFFLSMLPMVLMVNDEIRRQREELVALFARHDAGDRLSPEQRTLAASLAREYGLQGDPLASDGVRRALLERVDTIPTSLALAQAATESAYGTSRFARQGNNLFGEWTFIPGTGLVPKERPPGATYEVRRFATPYDSVRSYLRNLNTHRAYRLLREQRTHLRTAGRPLKGMDLARGLEKYSTRGEAYVEDIRAIIRRNHLSLLATVTLRDPHSPPATEAAVEEAAPSGAGLLASLTPSSRSQSRRINP